MQNFRELKIEQIIKSENNPRIELRGIEELAASIKASGILVPLIVREVPGTFDSKRAGLDGVDPKATYELIAGHRRLAAAEAIGLTELPCVMRSQDETEKDAAMQRLIENVQRDELMPHEIALGIKIAMNRKVKQKVLAKELGKSEAWVSKFVTIVKAIEKMVKEKGDFDITKTQLGGGNAELVYNWAQRYLNPKTDDVPGGEGEGDDQGDLDLEKGEIEVIAELRAMAALQTGVKSQEIEVIPSGKNGYEIRFKFRNEKAARDAFGHAFAE